MKRRSAVVLAVHALALWSCNQADSPTEAIASHSYPDDAASVRDIERRFIAAWEAKDPSAKALYARDAVMVVPGQSPKAEPGSIAQAFDRYAANPNARIDFTNVGTVVSRGGDLAFSQGVYTTRVTDPGTRAITEQRGYYLLIYMKQPDGGWKVIQDVSSPLPNEVAPPGAM